MVAGELMLVKDNLLVIRMDVAGLTQWGSSWPWGRVCGRGGIRKNCGNLWNRVKCGPCTVRISQMLRNEYNVCRCSQEAVMAGERILTLRLDGGLRGKLDKLAAATRRSRAFLAGEAIRDYVALNSWQIEEIHKGLAEADRGDLATESGAQRVGAKWGR